MSSEGWEIIKQRKSYGRHVTITMDDGGVRVAVSDLNPLGMQIIGDRDMIDGEPLNPDGAKLDIRPTREAADKIGFAINRLLEEVEALKPTSRWEKGTNDKVVFIDEVQEGNAA